MAGSVASCELKRALASLFVTLRVNRGAAAAVPGVGVRDWWTSSWRAPQQTPQGFVNPRVARQVLLTQAASQASSFGPLRTHNTQHTQALPLSTPHHTQVQIITNQITSSFVKMDAAGPHDYLKDVALGTSIIAVSFKGVCGAWLGGVHADRQRGALAHALWCSTTCSQSLKPFQQLFVRCQAAHLCWLC